MDAATIALALDGKRHGNSYRCKCPLHDGKSDNSLAVSDGAGTILFHCFGGCAGADLVRYFRDLGLMPDATPEQKKEWSRKQARNNASAAGDYLMVAESALERGEKLTRREHRKLFIARKTVEAASE